MARKKWQDPEYGRIAGYGIKRPDPVGLSQLQRTQLKPYEEQIKALGTEEEKIVFTRSILEDTTQRTHAYQQASSDMAQTLAITRPETQMERYDRLTQEWTKRGRGSLPLTPGTGLQMFNDEIERLLIEVSDDWYTKVKPYHGEYAAGPGKWETAEEAVKALTLIAAPVVGIGEYAGEIIGGEIGARGGEGGRKTGQEWGEIIGGIGSATGLVRKGIPGAIRAFRGSADEAAALLKPEARALTADGGFRQVGLTAIDELESRKVKAGKAIGTWKTWLNNEEVVIGNDAITNKFIIGLHKAKTAVRKQAKQYKRERAGIAAHMIHYEGDLVRAYDDIEKAFRRGASDLEIDKYKAQIEKITEKQKQALTGEFKRVGMDLPDHLTMDESEIFHMMDRISAAGPRGLIKKAADKVASQDIKPVYGSTTKAILAKSQTGTRGLLKAGDSTLPKTFTDPKTGEIKAIGSTDLLLDWRDPANASTRNILDTFEVGNARHAFMNMMVGNRVPTKYEQKLLAKALGPGMEEALNTWRTTPERIRSSLFEIAGAPISILSSMDMSAPLFQGMFLVARNLRDRETYRAFKDMAKAMFSERHARDLQRALYNKPNFNKFKRSGLFINEGSLGAKEEAFISSLPQRIPGIGKAIRGSERAYSTFLNQMRYHYVNKVYTSWFDTAKAAQLPGGRSYDKIVPITTEGLDAAEIAARTVDGKYIGELKTRKTFLGEVGAGRNEKLLEDFTRGTIDDDLRNLVKLANFATGRGTGLGGDTLNKIGSVTFYAPRLATSRFNLLGQGTKNIVAGSDNVRKESAKLLVSGFGSMMAVMGAIELGSRGWAKATGKEKPFSVELNPQSTDFAKIRMGSMRLDLSAGYSQVFRFVAQLATEQRKTTGTGTEMPQEWQTTVGRFLRSKFSPAMGTAWDIGEGETFLGEELETTPSGLSEEALRRLTPLFIQDVYDILETEGMTPQGVAQLGFGAPAAFFGVRATTYRSTADIANKYLKEDIVLTDENGERIYNVKDERLTPAQKAQIFNDRRIQAEAQELNRSTKEDFMMQMASLSENAQIARDQRFLDPSRSNPMPASEWREALTIASVQDAAYREVRKIYEGDIQRDQKFGGIVGVVMDIINKNEVERTSEEQSLADYYSLLDEYTLNPEQLDQLFGENFSAKSASDQELLLRGRSGFDMEGLIAARDQFVSRLGRKERDFVLNNIHPNRTPLQDAYYKAQKSLSNYWDIPEKIAGGNEALFALWKQFDSLPPNEKRIYAVQNPGVIRLDRMISIERMKMRRENISIDENLVAFYDASPMHHSLIREGRGGRNNLLIKTRVLSGIDRRLDESLNLRRLQRK